jgi:hypothetical protein
VLASALALVFAPGLLQEPPATEQRRREVLPNGAAYLVVARPETDRFCVTVTFSADGVRDTTATHGLRHLWEHFLAQGPKRDLDAYLETRGMSLSAFTTRDATFVQIQGPKEQIASAVEAVRLMLQPLELREADLEREKRIMIQEWALRSWREDVGASAWKAAFADIGLDPFGDIKAMQSLTVADLDSLHRRQCVGRGLGVVAVGDLDLEITSARLKELLDGLPEGDVRLPENEDEPVSVPPAFATEGHGRAALISGLGSANTLSTLAAAFAIRLQSPGLGLVYTPTTRPGLIVLTSESEAEFERLANLDPGEQAALFPVGRRMVLQWLDQAESDAATAGQIYGVVMVQGRSVDFASLKEQARQITQASFLAGWARLVGTDAVRVGGAR